MKNKRDLILECTNDIKQNYKAIMERKIKEK